MKIVLVAIGLVALVQLALRAADLRRSSLRSQFSRDLERLRSAAAAAPAPALVSDADLAALPEAVANYLRRAGVVGQPRVRSLHAVMHARMRMRPDATWMRATVEQHSFFPPGGAPARLFFMRASRAGLPFVGYHRYVGDEATMRVRLLGLITVADDAGGEMTRSETVTMLNDLCFLAPAALLEAPVTWAVIGPRDVRVTYTNAGVTVSAALSFDDDGDLVGFVSEDRYQSDGKTRALYPWSTPVRVYRDLGPARLFGEAEARWREPDPVGEWTYGAFVLEEITYNEERAEGG